MISSVVKCVERSRKNVASDFDILKDLSDFEMGQIVMSITLASPKQQVMLGFPGIHWLVPTKNGPRKDTQCSLAHVGSNSQPVCLNLMNITSDLSFFLTFNSTLITC